MKHKRLVSMIGMLVVLTCATFMMTGCPQNKGKIGGGVKLPDDLRNTSWTNKIGGITLEFGTNSLKYTANGVVVDYTIISAVKGGKIEISAGAGGASINQVLCESYSISGSTLTMSGGMHSIGLDYTKQ